MLHSKSGVFSVYAASMYCMYNYTRSFYSVCLCQVYVTLTRRNGLKGFIESNECFHEGLHVFKKQEGSMEGFDWLKIVGEDHERCKQGSNYAPGTREM